jgi:hypothetical protein
MIYYSMHETLKVMYEKGSDDMKIFGHVSKLYVGYPCELLLNVPDF